MDTEKIYNTALESLSKELNKETRAEATVINKAIANAIKAAFEEYEQQKN